MTEGRETEWRRRFAALTLAWLAFETAVGPRHLAAAVLGAEPVDGGRSTPGSGSCSSAPCSSTSGSTCAPTGAGPRTPSSGWATSPRWRRWRRSSRASSSPCRRSGARASPTPGTACTSSRPSRLLAFALPHVVVTLLRDRGGRAQAGPRGAARALDPHAGAGRRGLRADARAAGRAVGGLPRRAAGATSSRRTTRSSTAPTARSRRAWRRPRPGSAFDARSLAGSESCGTRGLPRADRGRVERERAPLVGHGPGFQRIQEEMAKQNGAESTRYCGGCHDPISLFSGTKNIFTAGPHQPGRLPGGRLLPRLPLDPQDRRQGQRQLRDGAAEALPLRAARGQRRRASRATS